MSVKYQVAIAGTGKFTAPKGINETMYVIRTRMRRMDGGPYRLIIDENVGPWKNWADILTSIRNRLEESKPGFRMVIDSQQETWGLAVRTVEVDPPIVNTVGNDRIDKIYTFTLEHFAGEGLTNLGIFNCRRVAGSYMISQHAYANAWDIGARTMSDLWRVANWIVAQAINGDFKGIVAHVIVDNKIWQPSTGWRYYGGNRHYHVHVDALPNYTYIPSCL
jgi:hypothetical protein